MTGPMILDGGDRRCVQQLIELHRLTLQVAPGTAIHLIATDPRRAAGPARLVPSHRAYLSRPRTLGRPARLRSAGGRHGGGHDPDSPWPPRPATP
jgi:tRNA 2-thiouridine synthesizing protein A